MHALSLTRSVPRSNAQIESSFLVVAHYRSCIVLGILVEAAEILFRRLFEIAVDKSQHPLAISLIDLNFGE
jgi:hypothetical protein